MKSIKIILALSVLSLTSSALAGKICVNNQMTNGGYKYLGVLFTGNTLPSVFTSSFCWSNNQNGATFTIYTCPDVNSTTKQCAYIATIQSTGTGNATFSVKGHATSSGFSSLKAYCTGAVKYQQGAVITKALPAHDITGCKIQQ